MEHISAVWNFGRVHWLSCFSRFIFIAEIYSLWSLWILNVAYLFSSVNLLIPERGVTTQFLFLSPSDYAAYHVWPPRRGRLQSAAAVNLQEHCAPPFYSSEAYMTNHTSHFKQLEPSLAINHLDTCYCAHNRAALRREENRGNFGSYSVLLVNTLLWNKLGDWDILLFDVLFVSMISIKIKVKTTKGITFFVQQLGEYDVSLDFLLKKYIFSFLFHLFFSGATFTKSITHNLGAVNIP